MRRNLGMTLAVWTLAFVWVLPSAAATPNVGDKAPEFILKDQTGKDVKLSDFLGKKNVVLAFYVLAFTGG